METTEQEKYDLEQVHRRRVLINHPLADEVSIVFGLSTHSHYPHSVEIAFFKEGEWVLEIIPEFEEYTYPAPTSTRVYDWVPRDMVKEFVRNHEAW